MTDAVSPRGASEPTDAAASLAAEVRRAGYYPELVLDTLDLTLAGEGLVSGLVQAETTIERDVHRHLTVLALTPTRLVTVHADDVPREDGQPGALATAEAVALSHVHSVSLTRGVSEPADGGGRLTEVTVAAAWGAVRRLDLEPAGCPDPSCQADHGLTGLSTPDDVVVRVAEGVEGAQALAQAEAFARALAAATAHAAGGRAR